MHIPRRGSGRRLSLRSARILALEVGDPPVKIRTGAPDVIRKAAWWLGNSRGRRFVTRQVARNLIEVWRKA